MTYYYIFCACGENVGKNRINKKAKRLIIDHLAFYFVPRPSILQGIKEHVKGYERNVFQYVAKHVNSFRMLKMALDLSLLATLWPPKYEKGIYLHLQRN